MNIALSRPTGYSDRVSLFTVKITDPRVISNRIGFEVPVIEKWLFCAFHGNRPGIPSETGHPVHLNSATRSEATQGVDGIYS
jgi:hypothetical protein